MMKKSPIETLKWQNGRLRLIDQTRLPHTLTYLYCNNLASVADAIRTLKVRGAPAIGIAAAFGVYVGMRDCRASTFEAFHRRLKEVCKTIAGCRPTAVNLSWALERMCEAALRNRQLPVAGLKQELWKEALRIYNEDRRICRTLGRIGSRLFKDGDRVLTICNAGALATADFGTALGVLYQARHEGKHIAVYACETRPVLQGARLTVWELMHAGIEVTLLCDNMAATLMARSMVDKVITGADRIAANGDVANKIGTYNLAVLARHHHIPFYVASPVSSFDLTKKTGRDIPIEERPADEVTSIQGRSIAPRGVKVFNPAFDVTPARLVTAIITERGIIRPPYRPHIRKVL